MRKLELVIEGRGLTETLREMRELSNLAENNLRVRVDVDSKEARTASDNVETLGKEMKQTEREAGNLGRTARRVGGALAAAFGAREIGRFFKSTIDSASDTNESINALAVTFGDATSSLEGFVANADQLGFSGVAAREAAVGFGALFNAYDVTQEKGAELSETLIKLSADAASVYNAETVEVAEAFGAAIRGEAEPARRFGVAISAAAVEQEALRIGLIRTKAELDQQAKALATVSLIQRQTANVAGDFGNTLATSLPNQIRVATAEFENFKAELGQQFQEPLLDAIKTVREFLPVIQSTFSEIDFGSALDNSLDAGLDLFVSLIEIAPDAISVVSDLVGVTSGAISVLAQFNDLTGGTALQLLAIAGAARKAYTAFGGGGAGEDAAAILLAADAFRRLSDEAATVEDKLIGIGEATGAGFLAFGPAGAAAGVAFAGLSLALGEYNKRQAEARERQELFADAVQDANPKVSDLEQVVAELSAAYEQLPKDIDGATGALGSNNADLAGFLAVLSTLESETSEVFAEFRRAGGDVDRLVGSIETGTDRFEQFQDQIKTIGIDAAVRNLREFGEAAEDPRISDSIDEFLAFGEAVEFDRDSLKRLADALDESADAADDTRKEREELAKQLIVEGVAAGNLSDEILTNALAYAAAEDEVAPYTRALEVAGRQQERNARSAANAAAAQSEVNALLFEQTAGAVQAQSAQSSLAASNREYALSVSAIQTALNEGGGDADNGSRLLFEAGAGADALATALERTELRIPELIALQGQLGLSTSDLADVQAALAAQAEIAAAAFEAQVELFASRIPSISEAVGGLEESATLSDYLGTIQKELTDYLAFQGNLNTLIAAGADDIVTIISQIPDQAAAARLASEAVGTLTAEGQATEVTAELEAQAEAIRAGYAAAELAATEGAESLGTQLRDGLSIEGEEALVIMPMVELSTDEAAAAFDGFIVDVSETDASLQLTDEDARETFDNFLINIEDADPVLSMRVDLDISSAQATLSALTSGASDFNFSSAVGESGQVFPARHGIITNSPTHVLTSEHFQKEVAIPLVPTSLGRQEAYALSQRSGLLDLIAPLMTNEESTQALAGSTVTPTRQDLPPVILQVEQQLPATTNPDAALNYFATRIIPAAMRKAYRR